MKMRLHCHYSASNIKEICAHISPWSGEEIVSIEAVKCNLLHLQCCYWSIFPPIHYPPFASSKSSILIRTTFHSMSVRNISIFIDCADSGNFSIKRYLNWLKFLPGYFSHIANKTSILWIQFRSEFHVSMRTFRIKWKQYYEKSGSLTEIWYY